MHLEQPVAKVPPRVVTNDCMGGRRLARSFCSAKDWSQFADNITETALRLGCNRLTVYRYLARYPELQDHRKDIVATMNDFAESTVKQRVYAREWAGTKTWLERHHPAYSRKQTIEHTGTVGVVPGLLSKDEILKLSDTELDKMDRALSLQLTALQVETQATGADDVRGDAGAGASDRTGRAPETTD